MSTKKDQEVQKLFDVVKKKKEEIAKAEKPSWETKCSFSFGDDSNKRLNLHTVGNTDQLIEAFGFLLEKEKTHTEAAKRLGIDLEFKWMDFTVEQWEADFKTRAFKINIDKEKKKLDILEKRLNGLVSKEMREEMELAEIKDLLGEE